MTTEIDISADTLEKATSIRFSDNGEVTLDVKYSWADPSVFIHKGPDCIAIDFSEVDYLIAALKLAKKAWKER